MRYYLHLVTDKRFVRDPEGAEFGGIAEAEAEAAQSARDLMCDQLKRGRAIPSDWRMLIATEDDTILKTIPFSLVAHGGSGPLPRRATKKVSGERDDGLLAETSRLIATSQMTIGAQRVPIAVPERGREDLERLSQIDQAIALAEERIARMRRGIVRLAESGADTSTAELVVATTTKIVEDLRTHRHMRAHVAWKSGR